MDKLLYNQFLHIVRVLLRRRERRRIRRWIRTQRVFGEVAVRLAFWRLLLEHVDPNRVIEHNVLVKFWKTFAGKLLANGDTPPYKLLKSFASEFLWSGRPIAAREGYVVTVLFWSELREIVSNKGRGGSDVTFDASENHAAYYELYKRTCRAARPPIPGALHIESEVDDPAGKRSVIWVAKWVPKIEKVWKDIVKFRDSESQEIIEQTNELINLLGLGYDYDGYYLGILWLAYDHPALDLVCPTVFDAGLLRHEFVPHRIRRHAIWNQVYHYTDFTPAAPEAIRKPVNWICPGRAYYAPLAQIDRRANPMHGAPSLHRKEDILARLVVEFTDSAKRKYSD